FNADTPYSLMHMHINELPPAIRLINPALPQGVQNVIEIALAKNPSDRYASAGEFSAAFQQALATQAVPADPDAELPTILVNPALDATESPQKATQSRNRLLLALASAALLVLALGAFILPPGRQGLSPSATSLAVVLEASTSPSPLATVTAVKPSAP